MKEKPFGFKEHGTLDVIKSLKGVFKFELIRDGEVIATETVENTVTNEGRNKLLDVGFHGVTPVNPWYIGLINGTSASNLNTDTMVSHSGWTEFVGYSESTRQSWATAPAASQQVASSAAAVFSVNASGDVQGFFISSVSTKSSTTGTLWSSSLFSSTPVTSGDQVKVTYTLTAN
jgi:hypothetical protein